MRFGDFLGAGGWGGFSIILPSVAPKNSAPLPASSGCRAVGVWEGGGGVTGFSVFVPHTKYPVTLSYTRHWGVGEGGGM